VKNFLESRLGKEIDVNCGSVSVTGTLIRIEGNVAHIEKDDVVCYINIEKIVAVWDTQDKRAKAPGFTTKSS
jgi:hypothetical protein